MKKIISLLLILFVTTTTFSQKQILVGDETWAVESPSGSLKVTSSSDTIVKYIIKNFSGKFTSFGSKLKKDRKGPYWEYTFNFPKENREAIVKYLNSI